MMRRRSTLPQRTLQFTAVRFASRLKQESGQQIAEAALVLPILFLILLGIFWFGRAFNLASTVERAAKHGIQTYHQTCATCGNTTPTNAQIVARVNAALQDDHLSVANVTSYSPPFACQATPAPTCTTLQGVEICTGAPLTCGTATCQTPPVACGTDPELGVRVSFGYRFTSPLPIANLQAITLHASALSPYEE
jgi:Flp pilus assembly protein TadG